MTGKTHLLAAGAFALAASAYMGTTIEGSVIAVSLSCIGGLLPDIDHKNSTISKNMKVTSFVARSVSTHRGLFHAPLFWATIGTILFFFLPQYFKTWIAPALFGVATHLFLDMLNPTGIPLFWPFSSRKTHIAKIRTGGKFEEVFGAVVVIAAVGFACYFVS